MKIFFAFLSALWGSWVGFGGYLNLKSNSDAFAKLFALGYYIVFAGIGLVAGLLVALSIWLLIETFSRRIKAPPVLCPLIAGALNCLVIWQITNLIYNRYPGLH